MSHELGWVNIVAMLSGAIECLQFHVELLNVVEVLKILAREVKLPVFGVTNYCRNKAVVVDVGIRWINEFDVAAECFPFHVELMNCLEVYL